MKLVLMNLQHAATRASQLFLPVPLLALRELAKARCCSVSQGSQCRNILNGKCPHRHSKQDIAHAGAIVEERIALPQCDKTRDALVACQCYCGQQDECSLLPPLAQSLACQWCQYSNYKKKMMDAYSLFLWEVDLRSAREWNSSWILFRKLYNKILPIIVKTIRNVSPHKAQLLYGTNGDTLKEIQLPVVPTFGLNS